MWPTKPDDELSNDGRVFGGGGDPTEIPRQTGYNDEDPLPTPTVLAKLVLLLIQISADGLLCQSTSFKSLWFEWLKAPFKRSTLRSSGSLSYLSISACMST
jgi:hypothetical protein